MFRTSWLPIAIRVILFVLPLQTWCTIVKLFTPWTWNFNRRLHTYSWVFSAMQDNCFKTRESKKINNVVWIALRQQLIVFSPQRVVHYKNAWAELENYIWFNFFQLILVKFHFAIYVCIDFIGKMIKEKLHFAVTFIFTWKILAW